MAKRKKRKKIEKVASTSSPRKVRHVSTAAMIAALEKNNGILQFAAMTLGINRGTIYYRIEKDPALAAAYEQICEAQIDKAEQVVLREVDAKDLETAKWYLDRKGKKRGYSTRTELTGEDGRPATFTLTMGIKKG